jgi:CheY-like chemotaxis protein
MARVLVVEDHADSSEALALFLGREGHTVDCAADGRAAMTYIVERTPDLVLLDLNIPEMNGADLVEMLRSYVRLHSVPVVVFTAAPDGPLAVRAKSLQVSAVLAKGSTSLRDIADTIKTVLTEGPQRKIIPLEKWRQDEISPL